MPDLLHDRLTVELRAEVRAHLEICADCRAELQLLERVHAVAVIPAVDSRRIVSALPVYRSAPRWRRMVGSPMLRLAAAIVLVVGGALLLTDRPTPVERPIVTPPVAMTPVPDTQTSPSDTTRGAVERRRPVKGAAATELAVGDMFHDLTDSELQALLDALSSLETLTPVETEVVVPAVNRRGT